MLDLLMFSRVGFELADLTIVAYAVIGYPFLAWRDRIPATTFAVIWVHGVVAATMIPDYRPFFGIVVALYTVTALKSRRIGLTALALAFVPAYFGTADEFNEASPDRALATLMVAATMLSLFNVGAWLLGRWVHTNHRKVLVLERQREVAAREAVAAERNRLARELHDIIAHCVSGMMLQAAGARRMLASDPDRAAGALADIEYSGRQAAGELRRLLGVIRADDQVPDEGEPSRQHRLVDLAPLLDRVRAGGVPVRLLTWGEPRRLDPSVDLSAYRIVQEALTNVTKYAGRGADTTVELRWEGDALRLTITDDGGGQLDRSPDQLSTGHGLLGLRERTAAVGGQLTAGSLAGGGFRVTALLPALEQRHAEQNGRSKAVQAGSGIHRGVPDASLSTRFGE